LVRGHPRWRSLLDRLGKSPLVGAFEGVLAGGRLDVRNRRLVGEERFDGVEFGPLVALGRGVANPGREFGVTCQPFRGRPRRYP